MSMEVRRVSLASALLHPCWHQLASCRIKSSMSSLKKSKIWRRCQGDDVSASYCRNYRRHGRTDGRSDAIDHFQFATDLRDWMVIPKLNLAERPSRPTLDYNRYASRRTTLILASAAWDCSSPCRRLGIIYIYYVWTRAPVKRYEQQANNRIQQLFKSTRDTYSSWLNSDERV